MSHLKTPLSRTLPLWVQSVIRAELDRLGKAIPATVKSVSGAIVTVNFQVSGMTLPTVEMPLFGPEYIRYPIQAGDKGVCFPADFYLGAMSGLGTGNADQSLRGNLSTLVFLPIGNKSWSAVDAQAVTLYGPNGVVLRDSNSHSSITLTPSDITGTAQTQYQIGVGSNTVTIDSSGITLTAGGVSIVINSGGVTIDGKDFLTHDHLAGTYVAPSGGGPVTGDSGPVVP